MAENTFGSPSVTQTTMSSQESTLSVTLHMPITNLKLVLQYMDPEQVAQFIKDQADKAYKTLKSKKEISENQVHILNQKMTNSLENLVAKFKEQVCLPLQVDPVSDSKETKLFKLRANKHVIEVLEDISSWLNDTLARVSLPGQSIDDKVKEYDDIIRDLKNKIKKLQTDKLSVEIHSLEEHKTKPPPSKGEADLKESGQSGEKNKKQRCEIQDSKDKKPISNGDYKGTKGKEANNKSKAADDKKKDEPLIIF